MNGKKNIPYKDVCAVIVTYRYASDKLHRLLTSISAQVGHICLIDNNDSKETNAELQQFRNEKNTVITNKANLGLATAINQGIRFASENHYRYVLLLDQDSWPAADMIEKLVKAIHCLAIRRKKVAAVGPVVIDQLQGRPLPFLQFKPARIKKISPQFNAERSVPVDFLISSGSLLDVKRLAEESLMDERLFIDNVDLEWCLRVKNAGYELYGVCDSFLNHRIGESVLRLPIVGKYVLLHPPERQYYIMRNRIFLYRRHYIPFRWKIQDFFRLMFKLFFFPIAVSPRWRNLHMMLRGILDGASQNHHW